MTEAASVGPREVAAVGPRFFPWGTRTLVGMLILGGAAIEYSIVGFPLQIYSAVSWLVLAFFVVLTWALFESLTQRSIIVEPTGVTFVYPRSARVIPWSRLQLSSLQTYP